MTRTIRTDFAAVNARGVTVRTFNDLPTARRWAWRNALLHRGLHVREVTVTVQDRWLYTPPQPKPPKAAPFAIPTMPQVA